MPTDRDHLDTAELAAAAAGKSLPGEATAHLASCPSCREELRSWQTIAEATQLWAESSVSESDRVLSSLLAQVEKLPRPADGAVNGGSLMPRSTRAVLRGFGRHHGRWLALAVVIAVVTLVVPLVTVGGGSPARPSLSFLRSRIALASLITERTGTVHFEETIRHDDLSFYQVPEDISGDLQPATGIERAVLTSPSWPAGTKVTLLVLTLSGYAKATVRSPLFGVGAWLSGPLGTISNPAPIPPGSPGQLAGVEGPIRALGHHTIAGTPVTGYRVTINVRALMREARTAYQRSSIQTLYLKQRITSFPAEVWLDNQGRMRKLNWQLHYWFQAKNKPAEITEIFSYHHRVLSLRPPPSDKTMKVGSFTDAIDQAVSQVEGSLALAKAHIHA